jgi:hypothetical protein
MNNQIDSMTPTLWHSLSLGTTLLKNHVLLKKNVCFILFYIYTY